MRLFSIECIFLLTHYGSIQYNYYRKITNIIINRKGNIMKKFLMVALVLLSTIAFGSEVKEGAGLGYADDIKVAVTMEGDKIVAIEVKESTDTPGIANPAIEQLSKKVLEAQTSKVDTVAGATYTSEGFLEAINNATGK